MTRALQGLLVVAIEQAVAAPMCTVRLADAGARVIKIERAEGETARHYDRAVHGTSAYFAWLNRGKESVVLDLKDSKDLALVHRMVAQADIFVQNLAPGATGKLGLDAETLLANFPRLICVDIVGFGSNTPYGSKRAYDMLVQAESGLCAVTGTPEEAVKVGVSVADIATGMNAHAAVLEALIARGTTSHGRAIEIAMFDGMADWMSVPLLHHEHAARATPRVGLSHASIYPYGNYRCRDGDLVIVVQNPSEWTRFCRNVLRRPELIADLRFADNTSRIANRTALDAEIVPVLAELSVSSAVERLETVRLAWARVSGVEDLASHPALRRVEVGLPGGKRFAAVAPPIARDGPFGPVPDIGQHTETIRHEFAGTTSVRL